MESPIQHQYSNSMLAFLNTLASTFLGILASVPNNIEIWVRIVAGLVAVVSGFFAARYYHVSYLEKKEILKNLKSNKNHEK